MIYFFEGHEDRLAEISRLWKSGVCAEVELGCEIFQRFTYGKETFVTDLEEILEGTSLDEKKLEGEVFSKLRYLQGLFKDFPCSRFLSFWFLCESQSFFEATIPHDSRASFEINALSPSFDRLPKNIDKLKFLSKLDIRGRYLSSLPDSLCNMNLTTLIIRETSIKNLPTQICELSGLVSLELQNNSLLSLPDSICTLIELKELKVQGNQLQELPEDFGDLILLENLNISNNRLQYLPPSFGKLESLKVLNSQKMPTISFHLLS